MRRLPLTLVVLLVVSSTACAQSGPGPTALSASWSPGQNSAVRSTGSGIFNRIVRNPTECLPDKAEPVWGATALPLGYTCYNNDF
jgi:hypothetical protein